MAVLEEDKQSLEYTPWLHKPTRLVSDGTVEWAVRPIRGSSQVKGGCAAELHHSRVLRSYTPMTAERNDPQGLHKELHEDTHLCNVRVNVECLGLLIAKLTQAL